MISRRQLVVGSLAVASSAAAASDAQQSVNDAPGRRRLKVIVTGGHAGDPEYGCGGTVARYTDQEHEVVLLYLNRGEQSCPETALEAASNVRVAEAKRACEILKARPLFVGQCDGHAVVDRTHYEEFRAVIEAERPDVLFTHWPVDGHPDHRAISMLAYDAWLRLGKKFAFYYYEVSDGADTLMFSPTDFVDITANEPQKRAACYAHASQAPDKFYALQNQVARFRGLEGGHLYAEAYIRHVESRGNLLP
ncbi:MAG TPA: PIG-L family deacetylase [Bryobacteraceae bacterium]|nr:PIG-L family deacetylase [Bryobacteraceae bacterium]